MVDEEDVFVGVSYAAKLQYEELKKVLDRASDSFNKFNVDNDKYEKLLSSLSDDFKNVHQSFEQIFEDLTKSAINNDEKSDVLKKQV